MSIKETLESAPTARDALFSHGGENLLEGQIRLFCNQSQIQSECSSNGETLPPLRFGAALPVSLQRWHHRTTELTPTLKISAISRRDAPLSTASTARSRKSVEYGLGIDLAPQTNQFRQIRLGDSGWESLRFNADGKCSSFHKSPLLQESMVD